MRASAVLPIVGLLGSALAQDKLKISMEPSLPTYTQGNIFRGTPRANFRNSAARRQYHGDHVLESQSVSEFGIEDSIYRLGCPLYLLPE